MRVNLKQQMKQFCVSNLFHYDLRSLFEREQVMQENDLTKEASLGTGDLYGFKKQRKR